MLERNIVAGATVVGITFDPFLLDQPFPHPRCTIHNLLGVHSPRHWWDISALSEAIETASAMLSLSVPIRIQ